MSGIQILVPPELKVEKAENWVKKIIERNAPNASSDYSAVSGVCNAAAIPRTPACWLSDRANEVLSVLRALGALDVLQQQAGWPREWCGMGDCTIRGYGSDQASDQHAQWQAVGLVFSAPDAAPSCAGAALRGGT
jgi:hypothetical protein